MALAVFALSFTLLLATAWFAAALIGSAWARRERWAHRQGWGERFWILIAAAACQIAMLFMGLSAGAWLAPAPFLTAQIALFALVAALWWWAGAPTWRQAGLHARGQPPRPQRTARLDPISAALLLAIIATLALSAAQQSVTPILGWDDRGYHATRTLYWIQYGSIAPFETHNLRQTTFPFLAELFFAWPVLLLKSELAGRMIFWLALPLTAAGLYLTIRELRVGRRAALAGVLLYIATPTVLFHAATLKPDAWHPLMVLGAAYFALRSFRQPGSAPRHWLLAGIFLGLAIAVKTTSLALVPGLVAVALCRSAPVAHRVRSIPCMAAGAALAVALSGFALLTVWNIRDHGHATGHPHYTRMVRADFSAEQVRVHAVRIPLRLFELPEIPVVSARQWIEKRGTSLAGRLGADVRLERETPNHWPGVFRFEAPAVARGYSLGGLLWLPLLAVGLARVAREVWRRWARPVVIARGANSGGILAALNATRLSPIAALVVMQIPLTLGVMFVIRWMEAGPGRFWLAGYALAIPVLVYFVCLWSRRWRHGAWIAGLSMLLLVWAVYPSVRMTAHRVDRAIHDDTLLVRQAQPYTIVLPLIEPPATILLIAKQTTQEYALFGPRQGYANRVIPWGDREFDAERLARMLHEHDVTHVVLDSERAIGLHGYGMSTRDFVAWLGQHEAFARAPVESEVVLFVRSGGAPMEAETQAGAQSANE